MHSVFQPDRKGFRKRKRKHEIEKSLSAKNLMQTNSEIKHIYHFS